MGPWHTAHLIALGLWGGLKLHYLMDVAFELPLLAAVVVTGAVLASQAWPLSLLHWTKIGAATIAVAANLWCVVHVVRRRRTGDLRAVRRHGRWVRVTASVGVPFAAVALYLGLVYFAR
jgi:hypothetical protein